jgi:hypothetical protein
LRGACQSALHTLDDDVGVGWLSLLGVRSIASTIGVELLLDAAEGVWLEESETWSSCFGTVVKCASTDESPSRTFCTVEAVRLETVRLGFGF